MPVTLSNDPCRSLTVMASCSVVRPLDNSASSSKPMPRVMFCTISSRPVASSVRRLRASSTSFRSRSSSSCIRLSSTSFCCVSLTREVSSSRLGGALDSSDPGESTPVSFVASRSRSTKSDSSSFDDIRKNYPSPVKL